MTVYVMGRFQPAMVEQWSNSLVVQQIKIICQEYCYGQFAVNIA